RGWCRPLTSPKRASGASISRSSPGPTRSRIRSSGCARWSARPRSRPCRSAFSTVSSSGGSWGTRGSRPSCGRTSPPRSASGRAIRAPALSAHPRAVGVVKSHGAEYFEGPELERALTLPALHRTSVFRPKRRGARREIYSWYLRLWPWEGNDLLYGLLRVEARAHPGTVALAPRISAWLVGERAPLATPDRRWDRLLYPIYDVESYLRARAPRDLLPAPGSRLPRTGT